MKKEQAKKYFFIICVVVILSTVAERTMILINSEHVEGEIISCDSKWVKYRPSGSSSTTREKVHYKPVAESINGDIAVGSLMMPSKALCQQQTGTKVTILVDKDNPEKNRIFNFTQFFALPLLIIVFPLLSIVSFANSILITQLSFWTLAIVSTFFTLKETGTLTKHFPELMTGQNLTHSEAALNRCVNTSMREENVSNRSEITRLLCQGEDIDDLSSISDLINLEELYLQDNSLVNLEGLKPFVNLKKVSVAGNKTLVSTKGIENATKLVEFQANKSNLSDLSGMEYLTELKVIGIMMNNISDISPLQNSKKLEDVTFNYNNISDLSIFENSDSLISFAAYSNPVTSIKALYGHTQLKVLGVGNSVPCEEFDEIKEILKPDAKVYKPKECN